MMCAFDHSIGLIKASPQLLPGLRGVEVCHRLFDAGKTPLAVAYLMHVSKRTILARHEEWTKLGGTNRPKVPLPERYPRQKRTRRQRLT
jgi:hypothetical protein